MRKLQQRLSHANLRARPKGFLKLPRPIAAYVGRLAIEKNIDAFLQMSWAGSKLLIGDGPERARLEAQYPAASFAGFRFGEDLAAHLAVSDIMVFPSLTDTFGLVNLEAMACGVPVDPAACRKRALSSGWDACAREFESNLAECRPHVLAYLSRRRALADSLVN